jgi:hypothetical protein
MGILDDAIKEHLELKRSHGASDDEVRRQEAEVFGPVRADAEPTAPPAEEHTQLLAPDADALQPAPDDPYAVHPGDDPVPDPEVAATPPHGEPVPAAGEAGAGTLEPHEVDPGPPGVRDHHHDEQHPALVDHDHIGGEEHAPEPVFGHAAEVPTAPPEAPVEAPPIEEPVEEPPIEEPPIEEPPVEAPAVEGEDEDVLEDTPEFLQDAPEHDRLWFEQKPPRDFDFGE